MLETPHVAVGAAIATKVGNPYLALPLALLSHFVMDKVPHWNPHLNQDLDKEGKVKRKSANFNLVLVDSVTALTLGTALASRALPESTTKAAIILAGCFLAVLPDVVEAPHYFFGIRHPWMNKFIAWQKSIQSDTTPFWGFITQSVAIIASLAWIFS